MTKWADKLIDMVQYDSRHTQIESVRYRFDKGDTVGNEAHWISRRDVISQIKSGTTFCTIFSEGGKWKQGSFVKIVTIGGEEFIKTYADQTQKDNLENLPELGSSSPSRSI